jgi:hypothetical protein
VDRRRLATAGLATAGLATAASLTLALAGILLGGCADTDSMPTLPATHAATGPWATVLDPREGSSIRAAWGLDADDMWFAGERGLMMHWDGAAMRTQVLDDAPTFEGIDGCAGDDVWAYGGQYVWRWDGRRWAEVLRRRGYYDAIFCEPPDLVAVAGSGYRGNLPYGALIHWYDGGDWKTWHGPAGAVEVPFFWRPVAGGPMVAVVRDTVHHAYRVEDGRWELLADWPDRIIDVDRDHVVYGRFGTWDRRLGRVEADLSITPVCDALPASDLTLSRAPLIREGGVIHYLSDCRAVTILDDAPGYISLAAVPERPGPGGPALFVAGDFGLVMQGAWQADWTVRWRQLAGTGALRTDRRLAATASQVFTVYGMSAERGVLVGERGADGAMVWERESLDVMFQHLRPLPEGGLLAWRSYSSQIAHRDPAGQWRTLDIDAADDIAGVWTAAGDTVWAMDESGVFRRHDGQQWTVRDELGGDCSWFDGRARDDMYAVIRIRPAGPERVVHFDGRLWRDVSPPDFDWAWGTYLAPHSGDIYLEAWSDGAHGYWRRHDGQWAPFDTHGDSFSTGSGRVLETADGELYQRRSDAVLRWTPDGWEAAYPLTDNTLDVFTIDPDLGVFCYDQNGCVLHQPYRQR